MFQNIDQLNGVFIYSRQVVRNYAFRFTMQKHINKITSVSFYHLRRLKSQGQILQLELYVHSYYSWITAIPSQPAINAINDRSSAGSPKCCSKANHVSRITITHHTALRRLHWLSVKHRMTYKLCLLIHAVHPGYSGDPATSTPSLPERATLRSATGNRYELPVIHNKFAERALSNAGPTEWNNLPPHITFTTDSENSFKASIETYLFKLDYILSSRGMPILAHNEKLCSLKTSDNALWNIFKRIITIALLIALLYYG